MTKNLSFENLEFSIKQLVKQLPEIEKEAEGLAVTDAQNFSGTYTENVFLAYKKLYINRMMINVFSHYTNLLGNENKLIGLYLKKLEKK